MAYFMQDVLAEHHAELDEALEAVAAILERAGYRDPIRELRVTSPQFPNGWMLRWTRRQTWGDLVRESIEEYGDGAPISA
jgi:hypothetical protein